MPLHRRCRERGYKRCQEYNEINMDRVQQAIDAGKLAPVGPVNTRRAVKAAAAAPEGWRAPAGGGEIKSTVAVSSPVHQIRVAAFEKAGGSSRFQSKIETGEAAA